MDAFDLDLDYSREKQQQRKQARRDKARRQNDRMRKFIQSHKSKTASATNTSKNTAFAANTHTNTSNTIICERDTKQKNQERSRHQQISLLDKLDRQSRHLFRENQQLTLKLQDKARQLLELKRQRNKWTEKKKRPRTSSHEQMRPSSPTRKKLRLMTDEQLRAELQRRSMRVSDGDSRSSVCISDLFLTCVLF